jgi:hypothetical protein
MHLYGPGRTLSDHGDARSIKFNHDSLCMVVEHRTKAILFLEQGQPPEGTAYGMTKAAQHELHDWQTEADRGAAARQRPLVAALSLIAVSGSARTTGMSGGAVRRSRASLRTEVLGPGSAVGVRAHAITVSSTGDRPTATTKRSTRPVGRAARAGAAVRVLGDSHDVR